MFRHAKMRIGSLIFYTPYAVLVVWTRFIFFTGSLLCATLWLCLRGLLLVSQRCKLCSMEPTGGECSVLPVSVPSPLRRIPILWSNLAVLGVIAMFLLMLCFFVVLLRPKPHQPSSFSKESPLCAFSSSVMERPASSSPR